MKVDIKYLGYRDNSEWEHYAWLVIINGVSFEYKTGTGHATNFFKTNNNNFGARNAKPANSLVDSSRNAWVHIPKIDSVLECMFLDADAGSMSFNEFCCDFGHDNDSLKAFDTYRECMEVASKLRKALGSEYQTERKRIESLNS